MPNRTVFEDEFSQEVWATTYKDSEDETVDDTMMRVAMGIAHAEKNNALREHWTKQFNEMLAGFTVTSGGRIYSNAGTSWKGTTLMNCFSGPRVPYDVDSLDGILSHLVSQSHTLKSEGGWGDNFSYIRPRGSFIHGIGVESPGSVKYMELFDSSSDIITQGSGTESKNKKAKGKIRKGAMMGVLDVWHPDIIEFVTAKQNPGRLSKFNMSVNCTDEFMNKIIKVRAFEKVLAEWDAAEVDPQSSDYREFEAMRDEADEWPLRFPDTTFEHYKRDWDGNFKEWNRKGYPVVVFRDISASYLWNLIIESTYNRAEPGVLFLDRANYFNPLNYYETIFTTNPCGEQMLAPGGVCDLGSINLTQFVCIIDGQPHFNSAALEKIIPTAVRFLDDVNDISDASLPEYIRSMRDKRRIGLGVLGWGSLLYMLKIRFGSPEAAILRDSMMRTIAVEAYKASIDLAVEKGMFKHCDPEKHALNPFILSLELPEEYMVKLRTTGIRNSSVLSIQPTGNTSIYANIVTGGLEPMFSHGYIRTVIINHVPNDMVSFTPKWYEGEWHETEVFKFVKEGDEEILRGEYKGTVFKIDKNRGLTKEVLCEDYAVRWLKERGEWDADADWAVTSENLSVSAHLSDMAGFAKYVDSAISKTINVPHDYPFEDFKDIYLDAYQTGHIKGVTTYRAGTMASVLSAKEEATADASDEEIILEDVKLPDSAPAKLMTIRAEGKKWYLTVTYYEGTNRPFAMFVKTNAPEKNATTSNAIELLIDLAREKGIPSKHIDNVAEKIHADSNPSKLTRVIGLLLRHGVLVKNICTVMDRVENVFVGSFLFQVKKFLQAHIKEGEPVLGATCDACESDQIVFQEGCFKCLQCGSSKCG